ncbi:zinc finger CCCH domain-containing protein 66-like [Telopea speciosissima]|uniref:zinc finger CCCH domain-containing protein 66-like n=1 Tax=Telopea speciosissima TaxID=54955 RepID=UPI001CC64AED|nr:zinc finger CCCH domain-containing protein 66-like [Telopea speciosissima]
MCSGSKRKVSGPGFVMEGEESQRQKDGFLSKSSISILLEASALDDLITFRNSVEENGCDVDETSFWYGRCVGSKKMGFEERTPLMIAAMFGSTEVLTYIIETGRVDVNRACGTDGVTALHCAVAGGSAASPEVVKQLLDASADANSLDANGNRPGDLIPPVLKSSYNSRKKALEMMLEGTGSVEEGWVSSDETDEQKEEQQQQLQTPLAPKDKDQTEKKEYPIDLSLPDIKNGIYGTDEFRMYTFKVKPCSRAYSHDWTECPFVHPGENARRRDPRKYHYSCVPCPEFRKGSCRQGDACEYAHGVFECWLHPAQYRTRLCKDETACNRRVCFFAHKPEELRPLYASTGSAVPSPRSSGSCISSMDMGSMSPMALGCPSVLVHPTSTPPMSPSAACSSPMRGALWQNQPSLVPPTMQLPGSRLKTTMSARDLDLELELLALEGQRSQQQKQLMDDLPTLSAQSSWNNALATAAALAASSGCRTTEYSQLGVVNPTNLDDVFGSLDPAILSQLHGLSLQAASSPPLQSPSALQMRPNMNQQLRSSYSSNLPSSPVRTVSPFGFDPSATAAATAAVMNSRSAAFAKRSQSFIDRSPVSRHAGLSTAANPMSTLSDWGSPGGKLDWGVQGEELNKLRKSASFGFRNGSTNNSVATGAASMAPAVDEPDLSWVEPMVKDPQSVGADAFDLNQQQQYHLNNGGSEMPSPWVEQLYMDQEQMVVY